LVRSLGSSFSTTACQDAFTRAPWQASSPHSEYHNSVTRVSAVGVSRRVSRTFVPSASMAGLTVNVGDTIPVCVVAVYVRFDVHSFAGSSSNGGLPMVTRLVPISILSDRPSVDDESQDLDEHTLVNQHCDDSAYMAPYFKRIVDSGGFGKLTVYDFRLTHSSQNLANLSQAALQFHS
jgi:hypothetical protein